MKLNRFDDFMDLAWTAHINDRPQVAFEQLHNAVLELAKGLAKEVKRVDSAAYHANNIASCLANGIQPD